MAKQTEQFAVLWLLFLMIVCGNSAVLAALRCGNKPKSRMNFFIMQLALADLCVGVLSVLTDIIWRSTIAWNAGNAACKVIRFSQVNTMLRLKLPSFLVMMTYISYVGCQTGFGLRPFSMTVERQLTYDM